MFKRFTLILGIIISTISLNAQLNMSLLGQLTYPSNRGDLSDIWGYVDSLGNEYAIVGLENGTSIVDVTNPSSPVEVFYSPGANTIWRDMKVWNKHAYITNEGNNGLKIIDMSNLPGAITTGDVYQYTGGLYPFSSAHDIYIDENGYAYVMGADNGVGGAIILDLNTNPKSPVEVGRYNDFYLHDGMARGDTLWGGAINDGFFAVIDVSNKANPVTMATQNTPSFFTHNCWISDDGTKLFTTDEVSGAFLGSYDVSNLSNITELDRIQSSPGNGVIPHNTFVLGNYIITSYYRDGVTIHDISNPSILVEVGNYDTSPQFSGNGFNGCWGVYPYLPSGNIIASDIENGLFILGANYTPASYLVGNVTDTNTTAALDNVQVDIVSTTTSTNTNVVGNYQTGIATPGIYDVSFTKFGYKTKTIQNVSLTSGNTTTLNAELVPIVPFTLQGQVIDMLSNPIANAQVRIHSQSYDTTVQTNASGFFSITNFYEGNYGVYIGKWGFKQLCSSNQFLSANTNTHVYQLTNGYSDDFTLNLGWNVTGNPGSGDWVRDVPNGTTFNGNDANPGFDAATDCMDEAYITGNAGGSAGNDDVDGGQTVLSSPNMDLSLYGDPYIHFERWFFNDGGMGTPNDSLIVELSNGITSVNLDVAVHNTANNGTWVNKSFKVNSLLTPTANMMLTIRTMDRSPGHIVESGFDNFLVVDSLSTEIQKDITILNQAEVFPTPFIEDLNIHLLKDFRKVKVQVLDVTGKIVDEKYFTNKRRFNFSTNYPKGVYIINVFGDDELIKTQKAVKL